MGGSSCYRALLLKQRKPGLRKQRHQTQNEAVKQIHLLWFRSGHISHSIKVKNPK